MKKAREARVRNCGRAAGVNHVWHWRRRSNGRLPAMNAIVLLGSFHKSRMTVP
jgi:hypothetical protein